MQRFRSFQPTDLPVLIGLYQTCFREAPWYEEFASDEVQALLEQAVFHFPEGQLLVATDKDVPVGAILTFHLSRKEDVYTRVPDRLHNACYVAEVFVSPTHRRKGLCKQLVTTHFPILLKRGFREAVVRTSVDQPVIQHIFGTRGFPHMEFDTLGFQQVLSQKVIGGQPAVVPDNRIILGGKIEDCLHRLNGTKKWRR